MFKWQRRKYKNEAIVGGGKAVKRQIFYNFSIEEDLQERQALARRSLAEAQFHFNCDERICWERGYLQSEE